MRSPAVLSIGFVVLVANAFAAPLIAAAPSTQLMIKSDPELDPVEQTLSPSLEDLADVVQSHANVELGLLPVDNAQDIAPFGSEEADPNAGPAAARVMQEDLTDIHLPEENIVKGGELGARKPANVTRAARDPAIQIVTGCLAFLLVAGAAVSCCYLVGKKASGSSFKRMGSVGTSSTAVKNLASRNFLRKAATSAPMGNKTTMTA